MLVKIVNYMKLFIRSKRGNIVVILITLSSLLGLQSCLKASKQCRQDQKKVSKMRKSGQIKM